MTIFDNRLFHLFMVMYGLFSILWLLTGLKALIDPNWAIQHTDSLLFNDPNIHGLYYLSTGSLMLGMGYILYWYRYRKSSITLSKELRKQ